MKIKDLMMIQQKELRISIRYCVMLLPIFQARLDIVARWGMRPCVATNSFAGSCIALAVIPFYGQGRLKPVIHKLISKNFGVAEWTGCPYNSWTEKDKINFDLQKLWEVN